MRVINLNEQFYLKQSCSPWMWDLIKKQKRKCKNGKETIVDVPMAFGMNLEQLASKIRDFEIFEEDSIEESDFKTYVEEYLKENKRIEAEFKKGLKELINNLKK